MPTLTLKDSGSGPLIDVIIGVSSAREAALLKAGQGVPSPVAARLLVDTGASHTCVDASTLQPLGLTPTGAISCHTPTTNGSAIQLSQYDVKILVPHHSLTRLFDAVPVSAHAGFVSAQGMDGLFGRDLLASCLFVYNGETGDFTLSF